ncbi:MAG TPA: Rieske 2Fe-2S domain-containing protein, partial [Acidimicrobiales bacterium]|nr:Rieske 2Fe-2S domain-containing protein [Acidimicrobiales bacterium]
AGRVGCDCCAGAVSYLGHRHRTRDQAIPVRRRTTEFRHRQLRHFPIPVEEISRGTAVLESPPTRGTPGPPLFDASAATLVLRAFLGVTFVFAGLEKLANPNFFRAGAPGSIQEQLQAALRTSPVPALVRPAVHAPVLFGVAIALAEVAVGLGTLLGLWSRVAAVGGLILSLTFFLTVSFSTWPYYYGADIVFAFAWTPFILDRPSRWSLDAAIEQAARRQSAAEESAAQEVSRRVLLRKGGVAGVLAGMGLVVAALTALFGRALGSSRATTVAPVLGDASTTTTTGSGTRASTGAHRPKGTPVGAADDVPVGGASQFTDPVTGQPAYAIQLTAGRFTALSAVCTHQGCIVEFVASDDTMQCPCHGSIYDARTGQVLRGPAPLPLRRIEIAEGPDGDLYVAD